MSRYSDLLDPLLEFLSENGFTVQRSSDTIVVDRPSTTTIRVWVDNGQVVVWKDRGDPSGQLTANRIDLCDPDSLGWLLGEVE